MKKNIIKTTILLLLLTMTANVKAQCPEGNPDCDEIIGDANNTNQPVDQPDPNLGSCPECTNNTWYDTRTDITIRLTTGEDVSFSVCPSNSRYPCNGIQVSNFPNALNENGTTNTNYVNELNDFFEQAVSDGSLDPSSVMGEAMINLISSNVDCGDMDAVACANNYILLNSEQNNDDGIGIQAEPCLITKVKGEDSYNCVQNRIAGIPQSLINAMCGATKAGSDQAEFGTVTSDSCKGTYDMKGKVCPDNNKCDESNPYYPTCIPPDDDCSPDDPDCTIPDTTPVCPPGTPNCNPKPTKPTLMQQIPVPSYTLELPDPPNMVCGQPYNAIIKSWGEYVAGEFCEEKYLYIHDVSVDAIQNNVLVRAGGSFLWGGTNGSVTTQKVKTDGSRLYALKYNAGVVAINLKRQYKYVNDMKDYLKEEYDSAQSAFDNADPNDRGDYNSKMNDRDTAKNKYDNYINGSEYISITQEYEKNYQQYYEKYTRYKQCYKSFASAPASNANGGSVITENETMTLFNKVQAKGSVVGVYKGTGELILKGSLKDDGSTININNLPANAIAIQNYADSFFVPSYTGTGTYKNALAEDVKITSPIGNLNLSFSVLCNLKVKNNAFTCEDDCDPDNPDPSTVTSGINVIYRPISLKNPFPQTKGLKSENRDRLGKWSYDSVVSTIITNNRGVNTDEVYNLTPMYTITLTPSDIKKIREYNKKNSYNNFNDDTFKCTDGLYCKSNFIWGFNPELDNFSYLFNTSESCAISDNWYNCYPAGADYAEGFYSYLKTSKEGV